MTQAVLGGTVDVRTLTGVVEMKIPKGTQVDAKLMLRGKGIPHLHSEGRKGNHIVHLQIEIPKKVSKRQEELLREFDEEMKHSGGGIYGRLAKAAGSAFETFFGHKDEKKSSHEKNGRKNEKEIVDEEENSDDDKKQQTA
jgi:DnaJ-class molecular chaperone